MKTTNTIRIACLAAIVCLMTSCASQERYFRSERSAYVSRAVAKTPLSPEFGGLLEIHSVNKHGRVRPGPNSPQPVLYYTADVSKVLADPHLGLTRTNYANDADFQKALRERRNTLAELLLRISDDNCRTFLNRAAYHKLGGDTIIGVFRDVLVGGAGAAAQVHPLSATSLAAGNLVVGAYDKAQGAIYAKQAFDSVETAIDSVRAEKRLEIERNLAQSYANYSCYDLLEDIRGYDEACSIRHGLKKLQEAATTAAEISKTALANELSTLRQQQLEEVTKQQPEDNK